MGSAVVFCFYRIHKKVENKRKLKRRTISTLHRRQEFRGNIVVPGKGGCEAVKRIVGTRFLEIDTPKLPLVDCDAASCTCRCEYFEDRRDSDDDRRINYG